MKYISVLAFPVVCVCVCVCERVCVCVYECIAASPLSVVVGQTAIVPLLQTDEGFFKPDSPWPDSLAQQTPPLTVQQLLALSRASLLPLQPHGHKECPPASILGYLHSLPYTWREYPELRLMGWRRRGGVLEQMSRGSKE